MPQHPPPHASAAEPTSEALHHLYSAAAHADQVASGDVFSVWAAVAEQIRLVAGGLDATLMPYGAALSPSSVWEELTQALEALDAAASRNTDHLLWMSHVHELRRITASLPAGQ